MYNFYPKPTFLWFFLILSSYLKLDTKSNTDNLSILSKIKETKN